jgi:hypothetical protein
MLHNRHVGRESRRELATRSENPEFSGNPAVVREMPACASYLGPARIPGTKNAQIEARNSLFNAPHGELSEHIFCSFLAAELRARVQEYLPGDPGQCSASAAAHAKQRAGGFERSRAHSMRLGEGIPMSSCASP